VLWIDVLNPDPDLRHIGETGPGSCFGFFNDQKNLKEKVQGDLGRGDILSTFFNTASSAAPQIPLCQRMLELNSVFCDFVLFIGSQTDQKKIYLPFFYQKMAIYLLLCFMKDFQFKTWIFFHFNCVF
jgi:hypothetical protein